MKRARMFAAAAITSLSLVIVSAYAQDETKAPRQSEMNHNLPDKDVAAE